MKLVILIFLSIIFQEVIHTQTPEQKKQMEEAKRKADSIMNLPHVKEMMKEAKKQEAEFKRLEKERKAKEKSKPKAITKRRESAHSENTINDFYWRNTIASNVNGQFLDWNYGSATLRVGFFDRKVRSYKYLPFGSVSKNGYVTINLPQVDEQKLPFKSITEDYSEGEGLFYYKHLDYSNKNAKWISARFTLEVHQGENVLGTLKIGNTIKPVVNLNSPCCIYKAGDGYTLSWVYLDSSVQVNGNNPSKSGGSIAHNLNFNKGWNLIKISVEGVFKDKVYNQENWKNKRITSHTSLPNDAKYYFIKR